MGREFLLFIEKRVMVEGDGDANVAAVCCGCQDEGKKDTFANRQHQPTI